MKIFWQGTDVLMMNDMSKLKLRKRPFWLMIRIIIKVLDRFLSITHLTNASWLIEELKQFGLKRPIEIMMNPVKHTKPYPKKKHRGFNILYYKPVHKNIKLRDWIYGIDLIDKLIEEHPLYLDWKHVNFIEVDQDGDLAKIFPIVDLYIRPNRHDGYSKLIRECTIQDIPFFWTRSDPNYDRLLRNIQNILK